MSVLWLLTYADFRLTGVFGVPLELLVEREGSDSSHGASRTPLRIPSFIDDVVSAMRQMGKFHFRNCNSRVC